MSIGLKSEVPDADESAGQHVAQKPPDEIVRVERHDPSGVASPPIAIAKGDLSALESNETLVTNSDAVGVAAEIPQHLVGAGHRRLAVDDPFLGCGLAEQPMPERRADT